MLQSPEFDRPFNIVVDASDVGAGAVLLQRGPDEHPVCYYSRKFNSHQRAFSMIEKEALSLVLAIQQFQVYLASSYPITVYIDHDPLRFLNKMRNSNQRLLRWSLILQPYDLEIMHVRGADNILADSLSHGH